MSEMSEEKKLTDDTEIDVGMIVKALECCKKNEVECTCAYCSECPASDWDCEEDITDCTVDLFQKAINLIHRLQDEIERLTEENAILKGNPPILVGRSLGKTIRAKLLAFDKMKGQNDELQKQVDELKKDLRRSVELLKEGGELAKMNNQIINAVYQQAVKDTAKEILTELVKRAEKISFFDCRMGLDLDELAEKYGVEVE